MHGGPPKARHHQLHPRPLQRPRNPEVVQPTTLKEVTSQKDIFFISPKLPKIIPKLKGEEKFS
jgi:hypothetical protein